MELISYKEALSRVGLGELAPRTYGDVMVQWEGYPKPFACGHTALRGFGPLVEGKVNDHNGAGRAYQELCRVPAFFCGGAVLFSWSVWVQDSKGTAYPLNRSLCVVVDTEADVPGFHPVLKVVVTG